MSNPSAAQTRHDMPIDIGIPIGKMGVWWFLASEIMVFGGLLGSYVLYRMASAGAWTEFGHHLNQPIAITNTIVLLTSSLTMVLAHGAVEKGSQSRARNYLGLTVLLGLVFLCIKGFEYSGEMAHGFTPVTGVFWSFYYTMTGLHGLHVFAGIVANFCLFVAAARGRLSGGLEQRVEFAGLYWHFVDVVWIFLFPLLYLAY